MVEWYITTIILTDGVQDIPDTVDFTEIFIETDLLAIAHIVRDLDLWLTMSVGYGMTDYVLEQIVLLPEGEHERYWCN